MKENFYEVKIVNLEEENSRKITYYITKDEKYGIEIKEETQNKITENKEIKIANISESKSKVKNLINLLVSNQNSIEQMQYIVDDFLCNNNEKILN